jgi:hypothetical protein
MLVVVVNRTLPNGHQFANGLRIRNVLGHDQNHVYYLADHAGTAWAFTVTEFLPSRLCARGVNSVVEALRGMEREFSDAQAAFINLSRAYQNARSPNLVEIVTAWNANGTVYRATIRPDGVPLERFGRLEPTRVRVWLMASLRALETVHGAGVALGGVSRASIVVSNDEPVLLETLNGRFGWGRANGQRVSEDLHSLTHALLEAANNRTSPPDRLRSELRRDLYVLQSDPVLADVIVKLLAGNRFATAGAALTALEQPPAAPPPVRPWVLAVGAGVLVVLGAWAMQRALIAPTLEDWGRVFTGLPASTRCERHAFQASRDFFDQRSPYQVIVAPTDDAAFEAAQRIKPVLEAKLRLNIHVLGCLGLPPGTVNAARGQVSAQALLRHINTGYPVNLVPPAGVVGIILTSQDLYSETSHWRYAFAWRFRTGFATVSTHRLNSWATQGLADARLRKMVMKQIGVLHFKHPLSKDRSSVLYDNVLSVTDVDAMQERY